MAVKSMAWYDPNNRHSIGFRPISEGVVGFDYCMNTWENWHLIPAKRPHVAPPKVKTDYLDTSAKYFGQSPTGGGLYDTTNSSKYTLQNRTGTWDFYIDWAYYTNTVKWAELYSTILQFFQGVPMNVVLEDDKNYYYRGLITVDDYDPKKDFGTITLSYSLEPYKYAINNSTARDSDSGLMFRWKWDTFDFVEGVLNDEGFVNVNLAVTSDDSVLGRHFSAKSFNMPSSNGGQYIPGITIQINSYSDSESSIEISKGYSVTSGTISGGSVPIGNTWMKVTGTIVLHPSDFGNLVATPRTFRLSNFVMEPQDTMISVFVFGNIDINISIDYKIGKL